MGGTSNTRPRAKLLATVALIALATPALAEDTAAQALAPRDARDRARGFEWWVQLNTDPDSCRHGGDTGIEETPDEFVTGWRRAFGNDTAIIEDQGTSVRTSWRENDGQWHSVFWFKGREACETAETHQ